MLSFSPRGYGVCKFLIQLSSAICIALNLKLEVASVSYFSCSIG